MAHPAPVDIATAPPRAAGRFHASYRLSDGAAGPRFADPTEVRRLDDALAVAQVAVTALTTHVLPPARISTVGTTGCWSAMSTDAEMGFTARSLHDLQEIEQALARCFQAGALATGAELELVSHLPYAELQADLELVHAYQANAEALGRAFPDLGPLLDQLNYATDMGNVSHRVPSIHPFFGIGATVVNHDPAFTGFTASDDAQDAMVQAAVALAWTAVDAATRPALRARLQQSASSR
jgi:metal-dependent amidase/aminoacylase/carboxypeptidase family protein